MSCLYCDTFGNDPKCAHDESEVLTRIKNDWELREGVRITKKLTLKKSLDRYYGNDPLAIWLSYLEEVKGFLTPNEIFDELRDCITDFMRYSEWLNDTRFIDLCISYATRERHFSLLNRFRVGTDSSKFYICWARLCEAEKNTEMAENVFKQGLNSMGRPIKELKDQYNEFMTRKRAQNVHSKTSKLQFDLKLTKKFNTDCFEELNYLMNAKPAVPQSIGRLKSVKLQKKCFDVLLFKDISFEENASLLHIGQNFDYIFAVTRGMRPATWWPFKNGEYQFVKTIMCDPLFFKVESANGHVGSAVIFSEKSWLKQFRITQKIKAELGENCPFQSFHSAFALKNAYFLVGDGVNYWGRLSDLVVRLRLVNEPAISVFLAAQLIRLVVTLHSVGVVHGNIHVGCFLVSTLPMSADSINFDTQILKLCDFRWAAEGANCDFKVDYRGVMTVIRSLFGAEDGRFADVDWSLGWIDDIFEEMDCGVPDVVEKTLSVWERNFMVLFSGKYCCSLTSEIGRIVMTITN